MDVQYSSWSRVMSGSCQVGLNGSEVWAYVVELDDGARLRLDLTDWERVGLSVGVSHL